MSDGFVGENLIEEYMLLANETVDKYVVNHGYPCLHRVHDKPNAEKLDELLQFLGAVVFCILGYLYIKNRDGYKFLEGFISKKKSKVE